MVQMNELLVQARVEVTEGALMDTSTNAEITDEERKVMVGKLRRTMMAQKTPEEELKSEIRDHMKEMLGFPF